MNILITGAFGFAGTNLSKSLSTTFHHRLIAVDLAAPGHHSYHEVFIPVGLPSTGIIPGGFQPDVKFNLVKYRLHIHNSPIATSSYWAIFM